MKLDSRIKDRKCIFDCFNAHIAEQYIGEECYMTNFLELFSDLSSVNKCRLDSVVKDSYFYNKEVDKSFDFCLPVKLIESQKPQWRAFKDHAEYKEFLNDGIIESWIKIKDKSDDKIYELMYVGGGGDKICLGGMMLSVSNLFKDFELLNESTGKWQPFGVKE